MQLELFLVHWKLVRQMYQILSYYLDVSLLASVSLLSLFLSSLLWTFLSSLSFILPNTFPFSSLHFLGHFPSPGLSVVCIFGKKKASRLRNPNSLAVCACALHSGRVVQPVCQQNVISMAPALIPGVLISPGQSPALLSRTELLNRPFLWCVYSLVSISGACHWEGTNMRIVMSNKEFYKSGDRVAYYLHWDTFESERGCC